ncbi:MAG: hypothetical protein ACOC85_01845 [Thermoplasmatota archaeon]
MKTMVFETDLVLERTEGGNNLKIDMKGIELLIPVEKVKKIIDREIKSATISISTGFINEKQDMFVTSSENR